MEVGDNDDDTTDGSVVDFPVVGTGGVVVVVEVTRGGSRLVLLQRRP